MHQKPHQDFLYMKLVGKTWFSEHLHFSSSKNQTALIGPGLVSLDVSSLASRLPEDAMGIRRVELTNREAHTWCTDRL